jgi:hypothetical protein
VVDPFTGATLATVPVGTNPQVPALSPDGTVHVLCTGDYFSSFGIVYVIDPAQHAVVDSLAIGGSPGDLAIGADGMAYVAGGGWADSGNVYRYDPVTRTLLNGAANPWHSARGVVGVVPRVDGGVFAVCFSADSVIEHGRDGAIARRWQVGDGPVHAFEQTNRLPGDLNEDGILNIADVVESVGITFRQGDWPARPPSGDVNGDCVYSVADVVSLINVVFRSGHGLVWGCVQ